MLFAFSCGVIEIRTNVPAGCVNIDQLFYLSTSLLSSKEVFKDPLLQPCLCEDLRILVTSWPFE